MTSSFAAPTHAALMPLHRFAEAHCGDGSCLHAEAAQELPLDAEPDADLRDGLHRLAEAIERRG